MNTKRISSTHEQHVEFDEEVLKVELKLGEVGRGCCGCHGNLPHVGPHVGTLHHRGQAGTSGLVI